jgi:ssDNA-binding Zn-finger/Zn-ribbon topoisomerase 1
MVKIKYIKAVDPLWGLLHRTPLPWNFLFHAGPTSRQSKADELLLRGSRLSVFVYISRSLAKAKQCSLEISQSLIIKDTGYKESAVQDAIATLEKKNRLWSTGAAPNTKTYMLGGGFPYPGCGTKNPPELWMAIRDFNMSWFNLPSSAIEDLVRLKGRPLELYVTLVRIAYERKDDSPDPTKVDVGAAELNRRLYYPGSKGKIRDAFEVIGDNLVEVERRDGGRRYVVRFNDPTKKTSMSEELEEIEVRRQAKKTHYTENPQEMVIEISRTLSACFEIKGKQSDGQLNIDCPYCGHNMGLLQPSKGRRGSFSCNYCRKSGSAAIALSEKNSITVDEAWKQLNNGGVTIYLQAPVFEDIQI